MLLLALAARTFVTALFVTRLVRLNNGEPHRAPTIWASGPIKGPLAWIKDTELRHDAPAKTDLLENTKLAPWGHGKIKNPKAPAATRAMERSDGRFAEKRPSGNKTSNSGCVVIPSRSAGFF